MSDGRLDPGDIFLGRFRIERVLGAGSMGLVVSAVHIDLDQRVAIKLMLPGRAPAEQHQRFLREARICAKLTSPHVARVIDVGTSEHGAPYMIMEHLSGRDLAAELGARGPLPFAEAAGVVHRDLKPANLFLASTAKGSKLLKVLDFGVSKTARDSLALTGEGAAMGSPLYMAPEQMEKPREVDGRADVWALGITLYELVAGKTPFHSERIEELCAKVYFKPPMALGNYRSDAPPGFESVLLRCFEKERDNRWPDVAAFATALVPFGPPGAAESARSVAEALGKQTALPAVDAVAARTTGRAEGIGSTGEAVVKPATAAPKPRVVAGVVAVIAVIGFALFGVVRWQRAPVELHPAGSASVTAVPVASSAALPVVQPTVTPTAAPTATAAASASVAPVILPPSRKLTPRGLPVPQAPAAAPPASPNTNQYDGRK